MTKNARFPCCLPLVMWCADVVACAQAEGYKIGFCQCLGIQQLARQDA